jgi:hypothetical protein
MWKSYVALVPTNPSVEGMLYFLFSIASRDLEVEVFPSFHHSVNHESSITFRKRCAMNCPALNRYFSNTMSHYFDLFPLLIKKLVGVLMMMLSTR